MKIICLIILVCLILQPNLFASGISSEDIAIASSFIVMPLVAISVVLTVGFSLTEKEELTLNKLIVFFVVLAPLFLANLFYFFNNYENNKSLLNLQNILSSIGLSSILIGYIRLVILFNKKK
jgi:predicted membrane protein